MAKECGYVPADVEIAADYPALTTDDLEAIRAALNVE